MRINDNFTGMILGSLNTTVRACLTVRVLRLGGQEIWLSH